MATAKYLKQALERIAGIKDGMASIESPANKDRMKSVSPTGNIWPGMFGQLSGLVTVAVSDASLAMNRIAEIERLERIVSVFESLDIDLGEESLKALELLASERGYKSERYALSLRIQNTITSVQDDERDREYDAAIKTIEAAGFVRSPEDEYWDRDNERVSIDIEYKNSLTTYSWTLTSNLSGEPVVVDSGKSGEFARLLAAIAPKVQEPEVQPMR